MSSLNTAQPTATPGPPPYSPAPYRTETATLHTATHRFLPLLLLLFVGSGCAALIYEIVWLQLLQLVIGSTGVSLGVLLGTFMGGMCIGSLLLPRWIPARMHPLRVYAALELGIGILGLLIVNAMPVIEMIYTSLGGQGLWAILLRGVVAGVCLLPPTILMGATLPAIARWVETTPEGVSWMGYFYGGNIAGAVFGSLSAGFFLLRVYNMPVATYVAVGINVAVAAIALLLSTELPHRAPVEESAREQHVPRHRGDWMVYFVIALSGLTALGAEVVWFRLVGLLLGATVYTFSNILAVFLAGLGVGSSLGAYIGRKVTTQRAALGVCQLGIAVAIGWASLMVTFAMPNWPINAQLAPNPWYTFQLDLVRCFIVVFPGAVLWGASFPLALSAVASRGQDPARLVGGVYAANTVGAIVGSLAFSMVVIPWIGTAGAQRLLIVIAAASGMVMAAPLLWPFRGTSANGYIAKEPWSWVRGALLVVVALVVSGIMFVSIRQIPWALVAYGRQIRNSPNAKLSPDIVEDEKQIPGTVFDGDGKPIDGGQYCVYVGEGMNVTVAVSLTSGRYENRERYFHGAGKTQASSAPQDMRLQRLLGHISSLTNKKPKDVLVVACGAGVTAGTFVLHPDVEKLTICDIEPLVPTKVTPMFTKENYGVVDGIAEKNPHTVIADLGGRKKKTIVEVAYDDGRHYIRTSKDKFDIISSDPIDPWVKGCAALNTVEYYQMCLKHLKPGGVMSLWIPFYESNVATSKSVIGTFLKVFPHGIVWSNDYMDGRGVVGYDAVLYGMKSEDSSKEDEDQLPWIDIDELQKRLETPEYSAIAQSLVDVNFGYMDNGRPVVSVAKMLATYAGHGGMSDDQPMGLNKWAKDAEINTDRDLRLQFLAGLWLNKYEEDKIIQGMLEQYEFPSELFGGSPETVEEMKRELGALGRDRYVKIVPGKANAARTLQLQPGPR